VGLASTFDDDSREEDVPHDVGAINGHETQLWDEGRRLTQRVHEASFVLLTEGPPIQIENHISIFGTLRPDLHHATPAP
jgi:hypothetical protein